MSASTIPSLRNIFTDQNPAFPFESTLAEATLGIPKTPEVHMAITELATRLLISAEDCDMPQEALFTVVLRVASGAVLFGWPLDEAEQELRIQLGLPVLAGVPTPLPWITNRMDWLAQAVGVLRSSGVAVPRGFQRQRSNYGWRAVSLDD
jgi:hypothetical protein